MSNKAKVNFLVDLLYQYQPETLKELKSSYSLSEQEEKILKPGRMLGVKTGEDVYLYLDVAEKGLLLAKKRIQPNIQQLKLRLRKAKRLRLIGEIVAAVTSVGLISALFAGLNNTITIITAFVNFLAIICSLISNNLESPSHGGTGNLIALYESLVSIEVESETILRDFTILREISSSKEEIMSKVTRANQLAVELLKGEKLLWS